MRLRRILLVALPVLVAPVLGGCAGTDRDAVRSSGGPSPAAGPQETGHGARTDVGDPAGAVRGSFSESDEAERRERIALRVIDEKLFGDRNRADAETRGRILDALAVLHPVEVRNEAGALTGYLTTRFVSAADYPEARIEAQAQLERYSLAP
jgi:hypothetical protein